jgi:hypothetical protein
MPVIGLPGVPPTGVKAVVLNVTVTNTSAPGYLTVWPSGVERPNTSNLNFPAGASIPNLVVAKVGDDGFILFYNPFGHTDIIVDIAGWFS